jgi:hypothetical protein
MNDRDLTKFLCSFQNKSKNSDPDSWQTYFYDISQLFFYYLFILNAMAIH